MNDKELSKKAEEYALSKKEHKSLESKLRLTQGFVDGYEEGLKDMFEFAKWVRDCPETKYSAEKLYEIFKQEKDDEI